MAYTLRRAEVKQKLYDLAAIAGLAGPDDPVDDFEIVYSGKASKKVDGLYKSASHEIILHTENFDNDDELMYTAIHEFAHHIHFTRSPLPISSRAHTKDFWSLFHDLLIQAEQNGLYSSPFDTIQDFRALTRRIREEFLQVSGDLMKNLGKLLLEARDLCEKHHACFQDYLERALLLPRTSARTIIRAHQYDLNPEIGFENMRTLTRIGQRETREQAQASLLQGQTHEMVKARYVSPSRTSSPMEALETEKHRIERTIQSLQERLVELERRMDEYEARGVQVQGKQSQGSP